MKRKHYIIVFLLVVITSVSTYRIGIEVTKNAYKQGIDSTQAMLAFNHLLRYEELNKCLGKGLTKEASLKLDMSIISQKELISSFLNSSNDPELNKYISIRYPQGINILKNYNSGRGNRWSEPNCK